MENLVLKTEYYFQRGSTKLGLSINNNCPILTIEGLLHDVASPIRLTFPDFTDPINLSQRSIYMKIDVVSKNGITRKIYVE